MRLKHLLIFIVAFMVSNASAWDRGYLSLEGGVYHGKIGEAQDVETAGLFIDRYDIDSTYHNAGLIGLGYFFCLPQSPVYFGVNAYYLTRTTVKGTIFIDQIFPDLNYSYTIKQFPIYASVKATLPFNNGNGINLMAGVGPNIIKIQNYNEFVNEGGLTAPLDTYDSTTSVRLSAMAGIGITFSDFSNGLPIELGYRFFYLGDGALESNFDDVEDLNTGAMFAHALVVSIMFDF